MARGSDIVIAVIAILFPPAAVAMLTGMSYAGGLAATRSRPHPLVADSQQVAAVTSSSTSVLPFSATFRIFEFGHIHAFWILWKKMKAEELYGVQGYQYLGNGEFVAVAGGPPQANHRAPPPPHYGSTR
ncbi:uncharacterized protein EHS24_003482 [Apiotrichum porosum]|uniref:Uncharacterized protein n=1 Tax=Apiotrichum porosum TaxID=105984 RepID=A0A427XED0_9TREE|nr:uncharacterized protein EHS24_003482 [Apiotrichum porosum]RSH77182.1 hypothetical protein EHS24_003482 [Apiotrichum porosum]